MYNVIACGACFDACEHDARAYEDDTLRFFEDLARGESISILIAPSLRANYPGQYAHILGALRAAGVRRMLSVSFGADIATWGIVRYIQENDFRGAISQACPVVVDYIEKYEPELIPLLMLVQSPLMCTAIYIRNQLGIRDKLAFISPCIAKKMEIADPENKGLVSYNVTFDHLMRYLREHDLNGGPCTDELPYEMGTIWPILVQVANNLKQGAAENNGVVARLKNDDFLVLFIGKTLDEACPEIRALIEAVESPVTAGNDRFSMTAKLGIVNAEQGQGINSDAFNEPGVR